MKRRLDCLSNAGEMYSVAIGPFKDALAGWLKHATSVLWVPTKVECQRAAAIAQNERFWVKGKRDVWLKKELNRILGDPSLR